MTLQKLKAPVVKHLSPPDFCDICKREIVYVFIDGKTIHGPWANMCLRCYELIGVGLGTGKGQKYQLHGDGKTWTKVEG
jgi:hypothetical protein